MKAKKAKKAKPVLKLTEEWQEATNFTTSKFTFTGFFTGLRLRFKV